MANMENMKIWAVGLMVMAAATGWAQDNKTQAGDSIVDALKVRELNIRKQKLQQRRRARGLYVVEQNLPLPHQNLARSRRLNRGLPLLGVYDSND